MGGVGVLGAFRSYKHFPHLHLRALLVEYLVALVNVGEGTLALCRLVTLLHLLRLAATVTDRGTYFFLELIIGMSSA